jgi:thiosulfate/3-mercaptopyruvate sulfurtransferase
MHLLLLALATTLGGGPRLVTTSWLAAHLKDPDLVILHFGPADTYATHIPGAQRIDMTQIAANAGPVDTSQLAVEMLPPEVLRTKLESYGISDRSTVVVYSATAERWPGATRVVFTLRVAGLGAHVALLDGGLPAWVAERRPVAAEAPQPSPGRISAQPIPTLVVDASWVRNHLQRPGVVVIDARHDHFYNGTQQGSSRSGHIPGAKNIPYGEMIDSTGHFRSTAELRSLFRTAGVQPGDTIVAYCHVGVQATGVLFAADQLGYPTKLYDGSFDDWAKRKELPVDNPAAATAK